ncbi:MAG: hypothetical protein GF308_22245 [Candidatus Heimdallarchaeota archaeon]|nr:hypothetical protein [Candidatus Heimdallarchaeota archaeon]
METGHTFEYLEKNAPELLERIKTLVKSNVVELLATGYSHPILPLLPRERVKVQLRDHINYLQQTFGITPKGAWPPELAISPAVLAEFTRQGIAWVAADYEHFSLAQQFGNDLNLFERRESTTTEILSEAFWSKGVKKISSYWRAYKQLLQMNKQHTKPLRKLATTNEQAIRGFLCSVSWTNATQFAVGGHIPLYSRKKHLKAVLQSPAKHLPLYGSDIEFFGYRELAAEPAHPQALIDFLRQLNKQGIKTVSPSQISDWPTESSFIGTGSWSPDKSFRLWTGSEDNQELYRRSMEIYRILAQEEWDKELMDQLEPYLRILENSDPRGWAPLPERKQEAYTAIQSIFTILEQEKRL